MPEINALATLKKPTKRQIAGRQSYRPTGRPKGVQNRRSEIYARALMHDYGDPLINGLEIAAMRIQDAKVVNRLATAWKCSRLDAVKVWASIYRDTLPYFHQRLPQAIIVKPGAPGGERVLVEIDCDFEDVTSTASDDDAPED